MAVQLVWLLTNGRLHAQIWQGPPFVGTGNQKPLARHELTEQELKMPLAALERLYPAPAIEDGR